MTRFRSAFVLSLTLFAATASAQIGQGTLTGVVTDPQGQVLPGVTVTATSTALIGTRTAVTETDGRFRFPALPSGFYKLKFDLSGFSTLERDNIQVVLGQTIAVDTQTEDRIAGRNRHRPGRITGRRCHDDQGRDQPQRRRADRDPELHRRVGRAFRSARRPYAGV